MLPEMIPVRQRLEQNHLADVPRAMTEALRELELERHIRAGMTVGIPVGSRGIRHIGRLIREAVGHVQSLGASVLVVAAMGSHGGGTVAGQRKILESLGITEQSMDAPVMVGLEVEEIARAADLSPIYFDRILLGCDALLVINRVKPHTSFHGPLESGLVKMLVVGCGKSAGAAQFHRLGPSALPTRLREFGRHLLNRLPVIGGIAVLEDGREETATVVAVRPEDFFAAEEALLERARAMRPRLPADRLDVLVVDQMGKDISGTGMDTNVIGRTGIPELPGTGPQVGRIVVLDLSEGSHGNANGVGMADLVTRRLVRKIDYRATYLNCLTVQLPERGKIPVTLESDREAIEAALRTLGSPYAPRIARIKNTLQLEQLLVSPAIVATLADRPGIEVCGDPEPWPFDACGNLSV